MRIGFWLTTPKKFDPAKIDETPFGGAEISAINLAKELSCNEEHRITVFGNCSSANIGGNENPIGVSYWPYESLKNKSLDVLICVRADQNLLNPRRNHQYFGSIRPKKVILWTGDAFDQPNNQAIFHDSYCLKTFDLIVAKSNWQKESLLKHFPLLSKEKVQVMYNGVDSNSIPPITVTTEPRFVYASTAYRGLHRFLDIWPKIKEKIPNATLDCYCKTTLYIDDNPRESEFEGLYDKISAMPGVTIKDPLPQKDFLKELSKYRLMLYPNSGFLESSCGVVLQSMACEVPVITTDSAGLSETVRLGVGNYLVFEGEYYDSRFVDAVMCQMKSLNIKEDAKSSRDMILENYSWEKVAERWDSLIQTLTSPSETKELTANKYDSQESASEFSPAVA